MELNVGIIGIGNVGSAHATAIFGGEIPGMRLAAICDISPERKIWAGENCPGVPFFATAEEFFSLAKVDTVIIATPHYFHTVYAMEGFKRNLNVLTEKPAGVRLSDVIKMNAAAAASGKAFGIMWNQRTNPMYIDVRRIINEKLIGEPKTLNFEATAWYRTQEYYDSGSWRATWAGEGGGVLMNQAPHQLDIMQWIFGMPDYVSADCHIGKYHNIEVEDEAELRCRYSDGRTAVFTTSTGIENGRARLEIVGTKGCVIAQDQVVTLYIQNESGGFTEQKSEFPYPGDQHKGILRNYANSILSGEPLIASGYEGINELTLTNAAYLSAWEQREVSLPLDTGLFDKLLDERRKNSKLKSVTDVHTGGNYEKRWGVAK